MQVYVYGGIGPEGDPVDPYSLSALDTHTLTARTIQLKQTQLDLDAPTTGSISASSSGRYEDVHGAHAALRGRRAHGMAVWQGQLLVYGGLLQHGQQGQAGGVQHKVRPHCILAW